MEACKMTVEQFEGLDVAKKIKVLSDEGCPVGVIKTGVRGGDPRVRWAAADVSDDEAWRGSGAATSTVQRGKSPRPNLQCLTTDRGWPMWRPS